MAKVKIPNLLDELKSEKAYVRSDAIKKIIKEKIDDESIIHALNNVIENDPNEAIRNFARAALDVFGIEHSAVEGEESVVFSSEKAPDIRKVSNALLVISWAIIGIVTTLVGIVVTANYIDTQANAQHPGAGAGATLFAFFCGLPVAFVLGPIVGMVGSSIASKIGNRFLSQSDFYNFEVLVVGIAGLMATIFILLIAPFVFQILN